MFNVEPDKEYYFRYEATRYSNGCDQWGESTGSHLVVKVRKYQVVKHTPQGVIVKTYDGNKFINKNWVKQFAHPTKELALAAFIARKKRYISILNARANEAKEAIRLAQKEQRPSALLTPEDFNEE